MKAVDDFEKIADQPGPYVVTIGSFDGVHIGHQAILDRVNEEAKRQNCQSLVITFTNHPLEVLKPHLPICQICTLPHKLKLLDEKSIDHVLLLTFTREFANHTAEMFIQKMQAAFKFSSLILGHDATIGKNKEGNRAKIQELSEKRDFSVEYIDSVKMEETVVSSSNIRLAIQQGNLSLVEKLLGRPYSIYGKVIHGAGIGRAIGFPTANLSVERLCLPPMGVYAVFLHLEGNTYPGAANLGVAPTLRKDQIPLLEVHLFEQDQSLYERDVEIEFVEYMRPEQKFSTLEALKEQIAKDVQNAKYLTSTRWIKN